MTIRLTPEQAKQVRSLIEAGQYESVEHFIDEAITEAYARTEEFRQWALQTHEKAQADLKVGRVVSVPEGEMNETLEKLRDGTLTFDR